MSCWRHVPPDLGSISRAPRVLASAKSELSWEEFVDGAMSFGAALAIADALATEEGGAELQEFFEHVMGADGRVRLAEYADLLMRHEDVLARYTGFDVAISMRFQAFFMTGRVRSWMMKTWRRLGLHEDDLVTWDEFRGSATSASG